MSKIATVRQLVETGKTKLIAAATQEALAEGAAATEILAAMIEAMGVVGEKFSTGAIFVPEMLISAKAMSKGVEVLKPHLAGKAATSLGTCVIGTVKGDLHDIGKNLVAMMLESAGFTVVDLGVDVPADKFIAAITDEVKLVACSGLLTTTMPAMRETVAAIKSSAPPAIKVLVGGAPVTEAFASEIGADGYAPDAGSAVVRAKELLKAA